MFTENGMDIDVNKSGTGALLSAYDGENVVHSSLTRKEVFELALELLRSTGVEGEPYCDIQNSDEAEQYAIYCMEEAILMREREENAQKEVRRIQEQKAIEFFETVMRHSHVLSVSDEELEIFRRAQQWARLQEG